MLESLFNVRFKSKVSPVFNIIEYSLNIPKIDYLEIVRIWLLNINRILDKQNTFIRPQIIGNLPSS